MSFQEKSPMVGRTARKPGDETSRRAPAPDVDRLDTTEPRLAAQAPRGPVSDALRLAAEVDRLRAELDGMRHRLAELEASAERDPLTGAFNRRGFERELARTIAYLDRYPARAMLVYMDLDRFKPVNDRHGHAAGDAILVAVTATLTRQVRASDSVARLGGDEFAVLLWNLDEADARAKADSLETAIAAMAVPWDGATLGVGASAGVTALGRGDDLADVVTRADAAMYERKRARRS
jgi:diguanylate cyclase (GGDEF)-like protein